MDWLNRANGPPRSSIQCMTGVNGTVPVSSASGSAGAPETSAATAARPAGVCSVNTSAG
ncbi:hypothetical protein ACFQXA_35765 [Nocardiopsis composta]